MGYVNGVEQPLTPLGVNNPGGGLFSTGNDIAKFMSLMFRNEAAFGAARHHARALCRGGVLSQ
jgi:CubicO group peptidase (beta-lactamase class C family)